MKPKTAATETLATDVPSTNGPPPHLPLLKTFADAESLAQTEHDPFYLAAFLIQYWLGGLLARAAAEYAGKKNPRDRSFQRGESWQAFQELFGRILQKGHVYLLHCLLRFSAADASPRNSLRRALGALSAEHEVTGRFFGPKTMAKSGGEYGDDVEVVPTGVEPESHSSALASLARVDDLQNLARETIIRWCDWLDAEIHLRTHHHWHTAPACFDPDPELRHLAALGDAQRHLAALDPHARACWQADFAAAAEHYQHSPKWLAVGRAMAAGAGRPWNYPEVETLVISLWPLVKEYNWTYRNLLETIRPAVPHPTAYPCDREQGLAAYCANFLGLRKAGRGKRSETGKPKGYEIAVRICPGLGKP